MNLERCIYDLDDGAVEAAKLLPPLTTHVPSITCGSKAGHRERESEMLTASCTITVDTHNIPRRQRAQQQQPRPVRYFVFHTPQGPRVFRFFHSTTTTPAGNRRMLQPRPRRHRASPSQASPAPSRTAGWTSEAASVRSTISESATVRQQEGWRRGRATRWPSSASSLRGSSILESPVTAVRSDAGTTGRRITAPLNDSPPAADSLHLRHPSRIGSPIATDDQDRYHDHDSSTTPEISRAETLSQRLQRRRSRLFGRAGSTTRSLKRRRSTRSLRLSRAASRAPSRTFSLRPRTMTRSLGSRRSTVSLRPQRPGRSLSRSLRSRRSTFSLRSSGTRHTFSTARARVAEGIRRSTSLLFRGTRAGQRLFLGRQDVFLE